MNQQCPQCQAPLKPDARFCGKCGAKVDAPDPMGGTQQATYAPPVPQAVERPQPQTPAQPQVIPAQPVTSSPPATKSKSGIGFAVTATFFVILFFGIAIFSVLSMKPTQQNPPPTIQSTSSMPPAPTSSGVQVANKIVPSMLVGTWVYHFTERNINYTVMETFRADGTESVTQSPGNWHSVYTYRFFDKPYGQAVGTFDGTTPEGRYTMSTDGSNLFMGEPPPFDGGTWDKRTTLVRQ